MCCLTAIRKTRLAVLLGAETLVNIEVDITDANAWAKRAVPTATAPLTSLIRT